jgi:hypothetical protein
MEEHAKQALADSYNKMREFLQFMTDRPDLSGSLYVPQFGGAIIWAKGATEEEARKKIAEKASKPFKG